MDIVATAAGAALIGVLMGVWIVLSVTHRPDRQPNTKDLQSQLMLLRDLLEVVANNSSRGKFIKKGNRK